MIGYCLDSWKTADLSPLSWQQLTRAYPPSQTAQFHENSSKMDLCNFGIFFILFLGFGVKFNESTDLYSLTVNDLQGNSVPMSVFKGKVRVQYYEEMTI